MGINSKIGAHANAIEGSERASSGRSLVQLKSFLLVAFFMNFSRLRPHLVAILCYSPLPCSFGKHEKITPDGAQLELGPFHTRATLHVTPTCAGRATTTTDNS